MVITKDFLDRYLNIETYKQYSPHTKSIKQEWIDWAYKNLIGMAGKDAVKKISEIMNYHLDQDDYKTRNEIAPLWKCVHYNIDYGFRAGDEVWYKGGKRRRRVVINKIDGENRVYLDHVRTCITLIGNLGDAETTNIPGQMDIYDYLGDAND